MIVAVIDLGSNSIRMTIAKVNRVEKSIVELADFRKTVRISEGMGSEKIIKSEAFEKTIAALKEFNTAIADFSVQDVIALSTEALRKASNRDEFINSVYKETGIKFSLITGEEEANYDFLGVSSEFSKKISNCILMDTGGGSCEFIKVKDGKAVEVVSLPLGGVVLTEAFLEKDEISASALFNLFNYIFSKIFSVSWLAECNGYPVMAIGGSHKAIKYVKGKSIFNKEEIYKLYDEFLKSDCKIRSEILGEYADRADIIVGGLAPLICIINRLNPEKIIMSDKGLRDGVLAEILVDNGCSKKY